MTDSLGAITWWGFSPSLNLLDFLDEHDNDDVNILLVGAGDTRHILSTLSHSCRLKTQPNLNFYLLESSLELYARHLLFLALALEPPIKMGLQEKTELFLELYGNVLIRQQSCDYVQRMATELIRMITDFDYLHQKLPCIDCTQLKYKERDFLEGIFKFWRRKELDLFDVEKCWDLRMRKIMGTRYDARMNTYDWDYHMKLCERQADLINRYNYRHWRHTGIAFEIRDGMYDVPNKTLASGLILNSGEGEKVARRGYWGDMMVGPYIAVALETEQPDLLKKRNGVYIKTSQDIAEYNATATFHEILTKAQYTAPVAEVQTDATGATLTEITEEEEEEQNTEEKSDNEISSDLKNLAISTEYESVPLDNVKVTFLPLNSLHDLAKKAKYHSLFDVVYFSNSMVHLFTPDITEMFKNGTKIVAESAKFMLELKKEQYTGFVNRVTEMATAAQCKAVGKIDPETATFLNFVHNKENKDTAT